MRKCACLLGALLAPALAAIPARPAPAATVQGAVRDLGRNPPDNGLAIAKVRLCSADGKLTDEVRTDGDGNYHIDGVADGDYTLVVTKEGYLPHPHDANKVKVAGDAHAADVRLICDSCENAYYSNFAANIVGKAAAVPTDEKGKVYIAAWDELRALNLPPSSKARLAGELNKRDPAVKEAIPDLKYYMDVKPEDVKKAELLFGQALQGKADLPGKDSLASMKINHGIVADLVLHQAKGAESDKQREAFVNEFLLKWDDTPASKQFLEIQKHGLEKRPLIHPPE